MGFMRRRSTPTPPSFVCGTWWFAVSALGSPALHIQCKEVAAVFALSERHADLVNSPIVAQSQQFSWLPWPIRTNHCAKLPREPGTWVLRLPEFPATCALVPSARRSPGFPGWAACRGQLSEQHGCWRDSTPVERRVSPVSSLPELGAECTRGAANDGLCCGVRWGALSCSQPHGAAARGGNKEQATVSTCASTVLG